MRRGKTDAYPAFPDSKDQLGYNPARFLIPTDTEMDELSWQTRVKAFIRGMDDVETIRAWLRVEAELELGNGGPRKQVVEWLNQRQAVIEGREVPVDETADTDTSACDEKTESVNEPGTPTPADGTASTETAVAADGGATPDETPLCPDCRGECTREEIVGKIGFWCPTCGEFREPITTEARA